MLFYIDQNIIGLLLKNKIQFSQSDDFTWIYSKEHLREIERSKNPERFLSVLKNLNARMLNLTFKDDFNGTKILSSVDHLDPFDQYEKYIQAVSELSIDDSIFDPILCWINGNKEKEILQEMPTDITNQFSKLLYNLFLNNQLENYINRLQLNLEKSVNDLLSQNNDIHNTRRALGFKKGNINNIDSKNAIEEMWKIIYPNLGDHDISCDHFFGFKPNNVHDEDTKLYLGIIGCNAVMDVLGYQSEKKCRRKSRINNVKSDANHIASAAFCSAIFSEDKKLINRAKAIYSYKKILTKPFLV